MVSMYGLLAAGAMLLSMAVPIVAAEQSSNSLSYLEVPLGKYRLEHEEWLSFLRENMDPDFEYWRARAPLKSADILALHNKTLTRMYIPAVMQLVLIYNNKVYWPANPDMHRGEPNRTWSSWYNEMFHRRLVKALASGRLKLPNALFLYNTDDNAPRFQAPSTDPSVPMLSIIKSLGLQGGDDLDILVPQMFNVPNSLYTHPWHLKQDRAFFRGIGFCSNLWQKHYGFDDACARLYLSYLTIRDQELGNGTALDAALVEKYPFFESHPKKSVPFALPIQPRVEFGEHTRYKWLLHLEGITASNRLGQLFLANSVVLFQRSPYIEYFYRSLRPWQHYVPFWNATAADGTPLGMDDVYGTLAELRRLDREQPERLQEMVRHANNFAIKFLTPYARFRYYNAVLTNYRKLFPDHDAFLEQYVAGLRAKGWKID
ncbi:hypothetical protein Agub_g3854 [Astrephomene gubernaculifera]|uniref:Glycosyl transferase CAP10 domain-containing protein n=1 Tax=Astrephomene gubernaculifera TaxID=47775 RepID=A0AAD3DLM9_9CHLO|nr:hypothetical protein Agub_g3854 [Astrephomene gubernaculifera]